MTATRRVEFRVEIHFAGEDCYRPLGDVSPVIRTLAQNQFDDFVKRVRVFCSPRVSTDLRGLPDVTPLLEEAIRLTD